VTPDELRRLAGRKRAEADEMAADADRLRVQAAALQGLLDPLVSISQQVWVGPAAADFEFDVRAHGSSVDAQADRLRSIAGQLDQRAASARHTASVLDAEAIAAEVTASTVGSATAVGVR
jgi:uncharacterized protein YukE